MSRNRPKPVSFTPPIVTQTVMPEAAELEQTTEPTDPADQAGEDWEQITGEVAEATEPVAEPQPEPAPEPVVEVKAVPEPVAKPEPVIPPVVAAPVVASAPIKPLPLLTPIMKEIQDKLAAYAATMHPSKASKLKPEVGGRMQTILSTMINEILKERDQTKFNEKWTALLNGFAADRETFSPEWVYRYPDHWTGGGAAYTNFRRLLWVIMETAPIDRRTPNESTINMGKALEGFTADVQNRLVNFYG